MKKIPFVDLHSQYLSIKDDIDRAIENIISETSFIGGAAIKNFEEEFRSYLGVNYFVSCANGTDSIEILLKAMGVGYGDEVIVPAISWISTSEAVSNINATPVFVDVEKDYYCMDVKLIEAKITSKTKVIIPVHLYGQPANMPEIMKIAKKHNLKVLEDCAQSHGAEIQNKKTGTWGDCASFSFYPGKNLGAYGDAGGMATNNKNIAEAAKKIANHGQLVKHNHEIEGRNSRLDTLQAAILLAKLPHLKKWTEQRIQNANLYLTKIKASSIILPQVRLESKHVFHLYVVRTKQREKLQQILTGHEIQTAIHYPTALPFLACYKNRGHVKSDFPVASEIQDEILSIPMYAELLEDDIQIIANILNQQ
ncbi:MAG: DegT/DnrJ/EryC1/StrS family aminotransferase [Bacteroidia bacterium]|nr:DegT/DnrJ/EryC1/StrS family aminotransferase [Bacteroidia bacterium]